MIYIFTEAGGNCGFGHLSRCISLYDECVSRGLEAKLVVNAFSKLPESVGERMVVVRDWLDLSFLRELLHSEDYTVVDSYLAAYEIYKLISDVCKNVVFIDDYMRISYPKGIVICPALYGNKLPYPVIDGVTYYGGSDYIILRSEFHGSAGLKTQHTGEPARFLITMGGTDILELTAPVLSAICKEFPAVQKSVVIGSELFDETAVNTAADGNTQLLVALDTKQMSDIIMQVDFAVTTAGQTIHELLRYGVPMIPILVADNQRNNIQGLSDLGFSYINALDEILNPATVDWKSLVSKTPRLSPMKFEGHKNVVNLLLR